MYVYRIKSRRLREQRKRIEGVNRERMEARLAEIRATFDPGATLIRVIPR